MMIARLEIAMHGLLHPPPVRCSVQEWKIRKKVINKFLQNDYWINASAPNPCRLEVEKNGERFCLDIITWSDGEKPRVSYIPLNGNYWNNGNKLGFEVDSIIFEATGDSSITRQVKWAEQHNLGYRVYECSHVYVVGKHWQWIKGNEEPTDMDFAPPDKCPFCFPEKPQVIR